MEKNIPSPFGAITVGRSSVSDGGGGVLMRGESMIKGAQDKKGTIT